MQHKQINATTEEKAMPLKVMWPSDYLCDYVSTSFIFGSAYIYDQFQVE